ncbi:MAG: hypothetical protein V9G19_05330 [Tetrasphaera sp.]
MTRTEHLSLSEDLDGAVERVLEPQCPLDWGLMASAAPPPPQPVTGSVADSVARRFIQHNHAVLVELPDLVMVARAIDRAVLYNRHAPPGGRRCVIVLGPSHIGKSFAVLQALLADYRRLLPTAPPGVDPYLPWTWGLMDGEGLGRAMLAGICGFHSIPQSRTTDTTSTLLQRYRSLIGPLGIVGVHIDDLGSMNVHGNQIIDLAGVLKAMVTSLPLTVVLTAIPGTPLIDGHNAPSATQQLLTRATIVHLKPLPAPAGVPGAWERMMYDLIGKLVMPRGARQIQLNRRRVNTLLYERTAGLPGSAIVWVKEAAALAAMTDSTLGLETLLATAPTSPPATTVAPANPRRGGPR